MYNFYLAIKDTTLKRSIPVLWTSAKTYYEENSKRSDLWSWADPWLTFDYSIEQILALCERSPPHVFGFSIYVWNEYYMHELAQRVKKQHPNCTIVYGGPQVNIKYNENFFQTFHWVDAVCPSDGYGEIIIKEILDHYPIQDWELIPYVWYADQARNRQFSTRTIEKKTFQWPSNIYRAQEHYFKDHIGEIESIILETTRGCPYKCIYCDWGGGTYTKLNSKPFGTILDEIEWVAKNQISFLGLPSANFGILPIDIAIAEHCVDMKNQYGYPKYVHSESAKNNVDRVGKIHEILLRGGMLNHAKVSIQTIDDEIKNNIERIDPPIEKQVANIKRLHAINPNLPVKLETIIGLPGDSYHTVLEQFDQLNAHGLPMPKTNVWMLLPEAPAYSPDMRQKFKIGTTNGMFISHPSPIMKPNGDNPSDAKAHFFEYSENVEMVVETYSYSRSEFVDMYCISSLALALEFLAIQKTLMPYLKHQHQAKLSEIIHFIYSKFIKHPDLFNDVFLSQQFAKVYQSQHDCTHGRVQHNLLDYRADFPFLFPAPHYIALIILSQVQKFLIPVCQALADHFEDPRVVDLGHFICNSVIDITYDPTVGRNFECQFNWLEYLYKDQPLVQKTVCYSITDSDVYVNTRAQPIDWHLQSDPLDRLRQYTFKQIFEVNDKISRTIKPL